MIAHGALGNRSRVASSFDRCVKALRDNLGVEPSEHTRELFERLVQEPYDAEPAATGTSAPPPFDQRHPSDRPPYKGLLYFEEADAELFRP